MMQILFAAGLCLAIDGDTIKCDGERLRIWGIDSPEMSTAEGPPAKAYMAKLIDGQAVRCELKGWDRYKRTLAICHVNNTDIACEMVRAKQAKDWARYSGGYYRKCEG